MYIQIKMLKYTIMSHKKRRAKYQTERLSRSQKRQFRSKGQISGKISKEKNTLTVDTDDKKFNHDNANGHSQTGNRNRQEEFTRQTE